MSARRGLDEDDLPPREPPAAPKRKKKEEYETDSEEEEEEERRPRRVQKKLRLGKVTDSITREWRGATAEGEIVYTQQTHHEDFYYVVVPTDRDGVYEVYTYIDGKPDPIAGIVMLERGTIDDAVQTAIEQQELKRGSPPMSPFVEPPSDEEPEEPEEYIPMAKQEYGNGRPRRNGKGKETLSPIGRVALNLNRRRESYRGRLPPAPHSDDEVEGMIEAEDDKQRAPLPKNYHPALYFQSPLAQRSRTTPILKKLEYGNGRPRKLRGGMPKPSAEAARVAGFEATRAAAAASAAATAKRTAELKAARLAKAAADKKKVDDAYDAKAIERLGPSVVAHKVAIGKLSTATPPAAAAAALAVRTKLPSAPSTFGTSARFDAKGRPRRSRSPSSDSDEDFFASGAGMPSAEKIAAAKEKFAEMYADKIRRKMPTINRDPNERYHQKLPAKLTKMLKGSGIFDSLYKYGQDLVGTVKEKLGLTIRNDYPPKVRNILRAKGDLPVVSIVARRDPIKSMLHTALNIASFGAWDRSRANAAYDKVFHLGLEVGIKPDPTSNVIQRYIIEKNAVINVGLPSAPTEDTEVCPIPIKQPTTLNKLLEGARRVLAGNMFSYDAFDNNCQDFIMAILNGSALDTQEATAFVKQPMDQVASQLPSITKTIAKGATNLGAIVDRVTQGAGHFHMLRGGQDGVIDEYGTQGLFSDETAEPVDEEQIRENVMRTNERLKGTFQKGVENTPAQYAKRMKSLDALNAKRVQQGFIPLPKPTYEQYVAEFKSKEAPREQNVSARNQQIEQGQEAEIQQRIQDAQEGREFSPFNLDGTLVQPGQTRPYLPRAQIRQLLEKHNQNYYDAHPSEKFFKTVNTGLIKAGDFVAENLGDALPFSGQVLSEAYKQFAPPGSKFSASGGKKKRQILRRNSKKRV